MSVEKIQEQYQTLSKNIIETQGISMDGLTKGYWDISTEDYFNPKELNHVLKKLKLTAGWLSLASKNCLVGEFQYDQPLLAGQACNKKQSIQINYLGESWQLVTIRPANKGIEGLIGIEKHLSNSAYQHQNIKYICFESLWQEVDGAMRKTAARFIGVEKCQ